MKRGSNLPKVWNAGLYNSPFPVLHLHDTVHANSFFSIKYEISDAVVHYRGKHFQAIFNHLG